MNRLSDGFAELRVHNDLSFFPKTSEGVRIRGGRIMLVRTSPTPKRVEDFHVQGAGALGSVTSIHRHELSRIHVHGRRNGRDRGGISGFHESVRTRRAPSQVPGDDSADK